MTTYNPQPLTPIERDEVYPYRRVWVSIAIENGILFAVTALLYLVIDVIGISIPAQLYTPINVLIVALPVALWLFFSRLRERKALQPRDRLLTVFVISALVANAVGLPVVENIFQTERWLPLSNGTTRIIGYTVTVGAFQEILRYLVIRFTTWPTLFRVRIDGAAYSVASAVGYASVINLHFLLTTPTNPSAMAMQVFQNVAIYTAVSLIVGYGFALLRFDRPSPLLMPVTVAVSALIYGASVPLRAGLTNAGFSILGSFTAPIFAFVLAAIILVGISVVMSALFTRSDRQAEEAAGSE